MLENLAVLIPHVAIIGSFFVTIIAIAATALIVYWIIKTSEKRKTLEHEQRMLAIEKGADIPMLPPKIRNPYAWPFVLMGIGLALIIGGIVYQEGVWVFGLILAMIGGGILSANLLLKKQKKDKEDKEAFTEPTQIEKGETI
ncbi:MAG: hypothetical protein P9X24_02940 [Candidatus Hatepunaea meridiana]|nr:hypothetical protein [Candidatus Hatepunaea meridiana]